MRKSLYLIFLLTVAPAHQCGWPQEPASEYNNQAELDAQNNVHVSSDQGRLIKMADAGHCLELKTADDRQTVGCSISRGTATIEEISQSVRLEFFLKNGKTTIIKGEDPILEWHFWDDGRQVAVYWSSSDRRGQHVLYEVTTGQIADQCPQPEDEATLPQWAKGPAELNDESVPVGEEYNAERRAWISKVMRRIATIEPGMTRADLLRVFTMEGGISTRFRRTYVYPECPYIHVEVHFKAAKDDRSWEEKPDDVIESISKPYLAGQTMD